MRKMIFVFVFFMFNISGLFAQKILVTDRAIVKDSIKVAGVWYSSLGSSGSVNTVTAGTNMTNSGTVDNPILDVNSIPAASVTVASGVFTSTNVKDVMKENYDSIIINRSTLDSLVLLSGIPADSTNMGAFNGSTISGNTNIKTALQELETEVETKITTILPGNSISIDNTDPRRPIVNASPTLGIRNILGIIPFNTEEPSTPNVGDTYIANNTYSATNYFRWSEENIKTHWNYHNTETIVTENTINDPNGLLTAERWAASAVNSEHKMRFSSTVQAFQLNEVITLSIYVKAGGLTSFDLGGLSTSEQATFDLTGVTATSIIVNSQNMLKANIESAGNGWYRCSVQFVFQNTIGNGYLYAGMTMKDASGNITFTGNGTDGVFVWGTQVQKMELSRYIPTTGVVVTDTLPQTGKYSTSKTFMTDYIYKWNGLIWEEIAPVAGHTVYDFSQLRNITFNGLGWIRTTLWVTDTIQQNNILYKGRVGIGVAPSYDLDVNGSFNIGLEGLSNDLTITIEGNDAYIRHKFNSLMFECTNSGGYLFRPTAAKYLEVIGSLKADKLLLDVTDTPPVLQEGDIYADDSENRLKYHDGVSSRALAFQDEITPPYRAIAEVYTTLPNIHTVSFLAGSVVPAVLTTQNGASANKFTTAAGILTYTGTLHEFSVSVTASVDFPEAGEITMQMYKNGIAVSRLAAVDQSPTGSYSSISLAGNIQLNTSDTIEVRFTPPTHTGDDNLSIKAYNFTLINNN